MIVEGTTIRAIKGDARSSDYSSCAGDRALDFGLGAKGIL